MSFTLFWRLLLTSVTSSVFVSEVTNSAVLNSSGMLFCPIRFLVLVLPSWVTNSSNNLNYLNNFCGLAAFFALRQLVFASLGQIGFSCWELI